MADLHEKAVEKLVADFGARIEQLRREGVPSYPPLGGRAPWAEAPETEKLEQIVWESMSVWLGAESFAPGAVGPTVIAVPGAAALEAVERHVDYDGLPAVQRKMLRDLRAGLDAGRFDGPPTKHKDALADALGRVVGVGDFDRMVRDAKEGEDQPWAERPAAEKVKRLVDLAAEAGPPGAYTLAVIEREVDYEQLPPWRREALEGLRARLDRGELDGEQAHPLYLNDRAESALRLAELEARIEDDKRRGALDGAGRRWPWRELSEEVKFDLILGEIRALGLESESAAYHVLGREVDMRGVPEGTRREFEDSRAEAWPRPEELDDLPTPEEWRKLKAEWTQDYGRRRLEERGLRDEDEAERPREDAPARGPGAGRAGTREGNRLPSPSEIGRNPQAFLPEAGHSDGHGNDRQR